MKIKKNDIVQVRSGNEKGRKARVLKVFPKKNKVLLENLNLVVKHVKSKREGTKGQRIRVPVPIHISNVVLICPKCGQPTRVGYRILANGTKHRECKKCHELI